MNQPLLWRAIVLARSWALCNVCCSCKWLNLQIPLDSFVCVSSWLWAALDIPPQRVCVLKLSRNPLLQFWAQLVRCKGRVVLQSLSRVQLSVTPWTAAHQAALPITNSWSLLKLMSIESTTTASLPYSPLSHPYMIAGKTVDWTRRTFAGKVISLLFNTLPRSVILWWISVF